MTDLVANQPLSGIRILDLTRLLPGPWATWQLSAMGKYDAHQSDANRDLRRTELASKVSDALRDDPMKIAMDLGRAWLIAPDGVPDLVDAMSDQVNAKRELEATELHKEGG